MSKQPFPGNIPNEAAPGFFSLKENLSSKQYLSFTETNKHDKCPNFLHFEFTRQTEDQPSQYPTINLGLIIAFGDLEQPLLFGNVTFGLRRGKLYVEIKNGQIPLDRRYPQQDLNEKSTSVTEKKQVTNNATGGIGQRAVSLKIGSSTTEEVSKTYQLDDRQLSVTGDETNPIWSFSTEHGDCFRGQYNYSKLGTLIISTIPCDIDAKFKIALDDLQVIKAEGLYSPDETTDKRKRCTLDRLIINHTLGTDLEFQVDSEKKKCSDYLSSVSLRYEYKVS